MNDWITWPPDKREVWQMHIDTGLDTTLRDLIEQVGQPEAVAIRKRE